jgi:hypothetical protein
MGDPEDEFVELGIEAGEYIIESSGEDDGCVGPIRWVEELDRHELACEVVELGRSAIPTEYLKQARRTSR